MIRQTALCAVHSVIDGDKADAFLGERDFCKHSDLQVVPPHSGKVFGNDAFYLAILHAIHHFHKARSLEIRPTPSVVNEKTVVQKSIVTGIGFQNALLV